MATIVGLVVALAGPPLFVVVPDLLLGANPSLGVQVILQFLFCGLAGFIVWVVISRERLPLQSIGLRRPDWSTLISAILILGVSLYVLPLMTAPLLNAIGKDGLRTGIQRLASLPVWFRTVVGATGGIVEETLYRGYAVERLATITGRPWLGATASVVAFGLAHIPAWGTGFALGADLPFGILMTLFYLWKRDLLANILAHSTALVVEMLIAIP